MVRNHYDRVKEPVDRDTLKRIARILEEAQEGGRGTRRHAIGLRDIQVACWRDGEAVGADGEALFNRAFTHLLLPILPVKRTETGISRLVEVISEFTRYCMTFGMHR